MATCVKFTLRAVEGGHLNVRLQVVLEAFLALLNIGIQMRTDKERQTGSQR